MEPDWSLWVHDINGNPLQRVDWSEGSDAPFSTSIAGDGSSSFLLSTNDADAPLQPGDIATLFAPNQRLLVRWWGARGGAHPDDTVMTAHKVEGFDYDRDAGTVVVTAVDFIMGETTWRMVGGVDADKRLALTISGRSASGAVAQTLARMMQWGPEWVRPLDLPADAPGDFTETYPFWKGYSIAEILGEISARTGVEIYFRPYAVPLSPDRAGVRFQTRVAAPVTIGGANFNLGATESPISGVKYRVDGAQQVTGILGIGNGTGEDQETRWAGGGPFLIPIRDTKKSFQDMAGNALQQATNRSLAENRLPIVQWDIGAFTVSEDYPPELVAPGRVLNIEIHDDPVIPDGVHTLRVIAVSGGNGRQLKPEVQYAGP